MARLGLRRRGGHGGMAWLNKFRQSGGWSRYGARRRAVLASGAVPQGGNRRLATAGRVGKAGQGLGDAARRHRLADEEALAEIAAEAPQPLDMKLRFEAFGHYGQ